MKEADMNLTYNPSAFPLASELIGHAEGMDLRDWFAGQALSGLIARSAGIRLADPDMLARHAYAIGQAMLETRQQYEGRDQ